MSSLFFQGVSLCISPNSLTSAPRTRRPRSHPSPPRIPRIPHPPLRLPLSSGHGSQHPFPQQRPLLQFLTPTGNPQSDTPISDLTLTGVAVTSITGVQFEGTIATITSATTPVNLQDDIASITWGDGTKTDDKGNIQIANDGTITVRGEHTFAAPGTFTVTITLSQKNSTTTTQTTTTATVTQNSPTGLTLNGNAGVPLTAPVGTFAIPATDNLTDPASFTATTNWGDQSSSTGTVTLNPDGTYTITGTHTFATAGTFRVSIVVTQGNPDPNDLNDDNDNLTPSPGHQSGKSPSTSGHNDMNDNDVNDDAFRAVILSTAIIV